ncbi:MAG: TetR/AcrR family transcriptional regulator [Clostridia bacterium]|nr:TetR/AcrR family transcriptional regulator [Clostridia bacterium]
MEQSRRLRKKDNTHRAIMHNAKMLFEKNGLGNVTVEQIAEAADVSRSTFFTHFSSVDDLLMQIANEEIDDILESATADGSSEAEINRVFHQLAKDTCPYPYLVTQLFVRSILSPERSSAVDVLSLITNEIEASGYKALKKQFSSKDISSLIFGAYFGLIFQKFIEKESFDNPAEIDKKINNFIDFLKNQEE